MKKLLIIFFIAIFIFSLISYASARAAIEDKELRDGSKLVFVKKHGKGLWFHINGNRKVADGTYRLSNGQDCTVQRGIIDDNNPVLKGKHLQTSKSAM